MITFCFLPEVAGQVIFVGFLTSKWKSKKRESCLLRVCVEWWMCSSMQRHSVKSARKVISVRTHTTSHMASKMASSSITARALLFLYSRSARANSLVLAHCFLAALSKFQNARVKMTQMVKCTRNREREDSVSKKASKGHEIVSF